MLLVVAGIAFVLLYIFKWKPEYEERIQEELEEKKRAEEQKRKEHLDEELKRGEILRREVLLKEVEHQAWIVGDMKTVNEIRDGIYVGAMPEIEYNGFGCNMFTSIYDNLLIIPIAGAQYRGNLKRYVGEFNGVLVPEPKNQYDPNAIKIICEDGKHMGYVPEKMTAEVRRFTSEDFDRVRITGILKEPDDGYYAGNVYLLEDHVMIQ